MTRLGITAHKRVATRATFRLENKLYRDGYRNIAGLDEVGRGAWAGSVVAAAAILPRDLSIGQIFESKSVNKAQRAQLYNYIKTRALTYGIGAASAREIEKFGMTKALLLAYQRALAKLDPQPDMVLVDGLKLKIFPYPHKAVIHGDQQSKSIAAASIIAKEYRDGLMTKLSPQYPEYGFHLHKGYGTAHHQRALVEHGVCSLHRKSYNWIRQLMVGNIPQTRAVRDYFVAHKEDLSPNKENVVEVV